MKNEEFRMQNGLNGHYSSFSIHHSPFFILHSSFSILHSPFFIYLPVDQAGDETGAEAIVDINDGDV